MWPLNARQVYEFIHKALCPTPAWSSIIVTSATRDSRNMTANCLFVAIKGDNYDGHSFIQEAFQKGASLVLAQKNSEYLKNLTPLELDRCLIVNDVLLAFRSFAAEFRKLLPFPIFVVGGSNGKTTTKEMLASLLSGSGKKVTRSDKSENGFLGVALSITQVDHNKNTPPAFCVIEIGIDEVGAMKQHVELIRPNVALLTVLGPEHLEGLRNWDVAAEEELVLFSNDQIKRSWQLGDPKIEERFEELLDNPATSFAHDSVIINEQQFSLWSTLMRIDTERAPIICIRWKMIRESLANSTIEIKAERKNAPPENFIYTVPMPGHHNIQNFCLALATAMMAGITVEQAHLGLQSFTPPPMRSNVKVLNSGLTLYEDCYNSSPFSLEAALEVLLNKDWNEKTKFIILADMLDLGRESKYWHEQAAATLKTFRKTILCLYGRCMYDCYKKLSDIAEDLLRENDLRILWLAPPDTPESFLDKVTLDPKNVVALVKGSRGMKLEVFVRALEERFK